MQVLSSDMPVAGSSDLDSSLKATAVDVVYCVETTEQTMNFAIYMLCIKSEPVHYC